MHPESKDKIDVEKKRIIWTPSLLIDLKCAPESKYKIDLKIGLGTCKKKSDHNSLPIKKNSIASDLNGLDFGRKKIILSTPLKFLSFERSEANNGIQKSIRYRCIPIWRNMARRVKRVRK